MTSLEISLHRIQTHLSAFGARFALIGGLAVSVRTEPRFTRDADLVVAVTDDAEAEALLAHLTGVGYRIGTVLEQHAVGRLSTVRLHWKNDAHDGPIVDLLFASSGIEPEIVADAEPLEVLPGLLIPVARSGHLIALKLLSRRSDRPQDQGDLQALMAVATDPELERARTAAVTIEQRGFNRGRALTADLAEASSSRNQAGAPPARDAVRRPWD